MELPTTIRGIKYPNWTDTLRWTNRNGWSMAEVDHDWRIWVNDGADAVVVRHKGAPDHQKHLFNSLEAGLAFLDYRADA